MCIFTSLLHTGKIPIAADIMTPQYTNSLHMWVYGGVRKKGSSWSYQSLFHVRLIFCSFLSACECKCAIRNHKSSVDVKFVTFQLRQASNAIGNTFRGYIKLIHFRAAKITLNSQSINKLNFDLIFGIK